jgi:hypothetical protein
MRYIPLQDLLARMSVDSAGSKCNVQLAAGHATVTKMGSSLRQQFIRRNGPRKWALVKGWLTRRIGQKCWYTEVELVGAPLAVDHFRPASKYWWLAFVAENYRLACSFSNSPQHNPLYGCAGGKGDAFPLLPPGRPATAINRGRLERPAILDPCNKRDCQLIAFQADGRPVISPRYAHDPIACFRVEESKILLNLDHPDFNAKREQLCIDIASDVRIYNALPAGSPERDIVSASLGRRISSRAPFSSAARYYLMIHRHLKWVDDLLARVK